jgi:hypothetical protein
VIWLITIAVFLGAVVAVMFVFCFFFQKEQILAALRKPEEHRTEARIPTRVGLELSGPDEPVIHEITFTENVSLHGARVVTKRRWSLNDSVLVKLPEECPPSRANLVIHKWLIMLLGMFMGSRAAAGQIPAPQIVPAQKTVAPAITVFRAESTPLLAPSFLPSQDRENTL